MRKYKYMIYFLNFLLIITFSSCIRYNKPPKTGNPLILPFTQKKEREQFKQYLYENVIRKNLSFPLTDSTEKNYTSAMWGIEQALDTEYIAKSGIKRALFSFPERNLSFYYRTMEAANAVFPDSFYPEVLKLTKGTSDPKLFAMGVHFLTGNNSNKYPNSYFIKLLDDKFGNRYDNPILFILNQYLIKSESKWVESRPSLTALLSYNFGKGKTIIFSFQRTNRNYPGLAIVRKPDGKFVRTADDLIFSVPQLARAITNLPSYITNGNTPQGIFSIQGVDTSKLKWIGPTTNIQLVMPFESNPQIFLHDSQLRDTVMNQALYSKLLPKPWRNYLPIYESYYAGKAGRTEIIAHGTTFDPEFYAGKPYYPNTPTMGCLCANEIWSEKDGSRSMSYQNALADAFLSTGSKEGYLIVVNLNNKKSPVTLNEIVMNVLNAEPNEN